jgi:hypothetical protein
MRTAAARAHEVIRVDAAWFAVEPLDMRVGVDTAVARVVNVFGEVPIGYAAKPPWPRSAGQVRSWHHPEKRIVIASIEAGTAAQTMHFGQSLLFVCAAIRELVLTWPDVLPKVSPPRKYSAA